MIITFSRFNFRAGEALPFQLAVIDDREK